MATQSEMRLSTPHRETYREPAMSYLQSGNMQVPSADRKLSPPLSPAYIDSWISVYAYVKNTCGNNASPTGVAGANVVAIDNKIEQAMDLVKTHLMYAVREEVEILRAQIGDLQKKCTYLEAENRALRQYAPAELLDQLGPPPTFQALPSSGALSGVASGAVVSLPHSAALTVSVAPPVAPQATAQVLPSSQNQSLPSSQAATAASSAQQPPPTSTSHQSMQSTPR